MRKTRFAGLTQLDPSEPLVLDGASFQSRNPAIIDHFLEVGAKTHRHDAHPALANPTLTPSASVVASGGALPPEQSIYLGYTLLDAQNGETLLSPSVVVSTQPPFDAASNTPTAVIDYTGGNLMVGTYAYAVTLTDGMGGETPLGPYAIVEREPGFASGRVLISGLSTLLTDGATAWRLWRSMNGSEFDYLASGAGGTFTDTGNIPLNCSFLAPTDNTTNRVSTMIAKIPGPASGASGAASINVYASLDGSFVSPSFLGTYPLASAGKDIVLRSVDLIDGAPPDVATALGGANKIDPDTELLDFPYRRGVASASNLPAGDHYRDVRPVDNPPGLWMVVNPSGSTGPGDWRQIGGDDPRVPPRETLSLLSPVLASGASGSVSWPLGKGFRIMKVTLDRPANVRLYATPEQRDADIPRSHKVAASGDHGLIMEAHLITDISVGANPPAHGHDLSVVASGSIAATVKNYGASGQVGVTLLRQLTEL